MTHIPRPPDWQLPVGVTPGLWEYLHDAELARSYLAKVGDSPFARADSAFVEKYLPHPCRVVDLGCGPGRSLLPLARRGFQCLGVDLSEPMLDEARVSFSGHQLEGEWLHANLCEPLPYPDESFDAALCLFGTFGMLQPADARAAILKETLRILTPAGLFLLHVHNNPNAYSWKRILPKHHGGTVTMPVHQGIANLQMKLFSVREITHLLHGHGFRVKVVEPITARPTAANWVNPRRCDGFLLLAQKTV